MAGVQDLPPPLAPSRDAPRHLLMLLGASVVVFSVAVEPPVHAGYTLAGLLLWLIGVARLPPFGQIEWHPLFAGALETTTANIARRAASSHLLALVGASTVVFSVAGKPPVHAGYALAGFLLWLLGAARLLPFGQIGRIGRHALSAGALETATANIVRRAASRPSHLLALVGASAVVFSIVGEPSGQAWYALAGFLLWLLGVAKLLLFCQMGRRPLFPSAIAAAAANLARRAVPSYLLVLIGASAVVVSVVGEPPVHAGFALAGFLLWFLGAANLLSGQMGAELAVPGRACSCQCHHGEAEAFLLRP